MALHFIIIYLIKKKGKEKEKQRTKHKKEENSHDSIKGRSEMVSYYIHRHEMQRTMKRISLLGKNREK